MTLKARRGEILRLLASGLSPHDTALRVFGAPSQGEIEYCVRASHDARGIARARVVLAVSSPEALPELKRPSLVDPEAAGDGRKVAGLRRRLDAALARVDQLERLVAALVGIRADSPALRAASLAARLREFERGVTDSLAARRGPRVGAGGR